MRILIIEDEKLLAESIQTFLFSRGFDADTACDGETGARLALSGIYDLLILDVMLPGISGCQLAKQLRSGKCTIPILMLSARSELPDRIEGLNSGADYYLTKPFDTRELLACIHALLRRQGLEINELSYGNTSLDLSSGTLFCGTKKIRLSSREFEIMKLLLQSRERNLAKETILSRVWGYDSAAIGNHAEVYIGFLRKKLASIGSNIRIVAIRRLGYHLEVTEEC